MPARGRRDPAAPPVGIEAAGQYERGPQRGQGLAPRAEARAVPAVIKHRPDGFGHCGRHWAPVGCAPGDDVGPQQVVHGRRRPRGERFAGAFVLGAEHGRERVGVHGSPLVERVEQDLEALPSQPQGQRGGGVGERGAVVQGSGGGSVHATIVRAG
jgi:hypothetical protein